MAKSTPKPPARPARKQPNKPQKKAQKKAQKKPGLDIVQQAGEESFPASDPPSWTPLRGGSPRESR